MGWSRGDAQCLAGGRLRLHLPPKRASLALSRFCEVANSSQMFSILNEIKDNTPLSVVRVVGSSIGSAASIYVLVAITGYITFGNDIVGNIVSMCKNSMRSA